MILEGGWGSTLSRMSSTLNYFNWLHLVFIFKNRKVFAEGWHSPECQAVPEHTHQCQWPPQWQKSYRADEAGRVLLVCWVGIESTALYMLDPHSTTDTHLHLSLCYLGSSDPPVPASWLSGTLGVCCYTPSQVFLISAIYEVEFYTWSRSILNLFLLVAQASSVYH